MFPEVQTRTERVAREVEALVAKREGLGAEEAAALDEQIQAHVSRWAREMEALGVEVKGVWLVDFDTGAGYYCWKWPEPGLDHFHGYEEGFAGRTRIQ